MQQSLERRFKSIRVSIMKKGPFVQLAPLMMYGDVHIDDETPTASTDGVNESYGRAWIAKYLEEEKPKCVAFGMVHENVHKAGRHLIHYWNLWEIDPKLANMAFDYWNNLSIVRADPGSLNGEGLVVEVPRNPDGSIAVLLDFKYEGWSIKRIFYHLLEEKQQKQQQQQQQGQPQEGDGEDADEGQPSFDHHDMEGAKRMQADAEQAEKIEKDIEQAIRQGCHAARQAGAGTNNDPLGLNELLKPKIAWEDELRIFASSCNKPRRSTYRRLNKRLIGQDILLPSKRGEGLREIVYARDTSGSMKIGGRLERATSEVVSLAKIMRVDKLHFIDWDSEVERHEVYDSNSIADADMTMQPTGGGGTDPSCLANYLREQDITPDCIIVATDGEVNSWGSCWSAPLLWVITNKHPIVSPVGKSIHVED